MENNNIELVRANREDIPVYRMPVDIVNEYKIVRVYKDGDFVTPSEYNLTEDKTVVSFNYHVDNDTIVTADIKEK